MDSENEDENPLVLQSFSTAFPKNCYLRMKHFENCIKKYLGVNKIRPDKLEKIKSEIGSLYDEDKLTRQNIFDFGKWKASDGVKGNENAIFFQITGKTVDDISHLEDYLLANFRLFSAEYDLKRVQLGRKKFLNMNYVLFHLLKQLGHKVDLNNFSLMKTEKARKEHDEIIRRCFSKLGWKFKA